MQVPGPLLTPADYELPRTLNFKITNLLKWDYVCTGQRGKIEREIMAHHSSHCLLLGTYLLDALRV